MEKSLYQAPLGLSELEDDAIEIEIENPDSVHMDFGDLEIDLKPAKPSAKDFDARPLTHQKTVFAKEDFYRGESPKVL